MFRKLLEKIDNTEVTLKDWILGILCIIFVRILLENFFSTSLSGMLASDFATIVHCYLYYLGVALSLMILHGVFVPNIRRGEKIAIIVFFGSWIPPLLDFVISKGGGYYLGYPFISSISGLVRVFFDFFGAVPIVGVTPGMRVQAIVAILGVLFYVIYATKSVLKGVAAAFSVYVVAFLWAFAPSIMKVVSDFSWSGGFRSVGQFFIDSANSSIVARNFLDPTVQLSYLRAAETFFDAAMSHAYYIVISILLVLYVYQSRPLKTLAVLKNSRPRQVIPYQLLLLAGFFLAWTITRPQIVFNWLDVVTIVALFIGMYCASMYAMGANDIADINVDRVSNPERPLIRGELSVDDVKNANLIFLIWALVGGFLAGYYALFMMAAALALSHIYSVPPLRAKRLPLFATFLMSLAFLAVVLAGFYTLSGDKSIQAFPVRYLFLVIIGTTLGNNVKDMKDVEGDRAAGIKTIPVLFGEKNGRRIVGAFLALAFLLVPPILGIWRLIIPSLIAAALAYYFVNRKNYREWPVFVLYFIYVAIAVLFVYGIV